MGCNSILLVLALMLHLAATASALKWTPVGPPVATRGWKVLVGPSGAGYAASRDGQYGDWFDEVYRTTDGGKTWKSVPLVGIDGVDAFGGHMITVGTGANAGLVGLGWAAGAFGSHSQPLWWSPVTGKWSNHTLAKPANVTYLMIKALVPVPGSNQAFALAWADIDTVRNGFVLHWGGNTNSGTWKLIKQVNVDIDELVVASPTAAWIIYGSPADIDRWNGAQWVKQRKGSAADLYVGALRAVPAAGSAPPAVWIKVVTAEPTWAEALVLCSATGGCATKKSGSRFEDFAAVSSKVALAWESVTNPKTGQATAHLQHYDGTKWTSKLQMPLADRSLSAMLSMASATRAVSVFRDYLPDSNTVRLVTHTWNGAAWTLHTNATSTDVQLFYSNLQALDSGSALLQLRTNLWRLA